MGVSIQIYINGPAASGKTHLAEMLRKTIAEFESQTGPVKLQLVEQRTLNTERPRP